MSDLAQGLYSDDLTYRHKCLKEFRKILSKGKLTAMHFIDIK